MVPNGRVLQASEFEGVFARIFSDIADQCNNLYDPLRQHMKPQWRNRGLTVQIIDNPSLNAFASSEKEQDFVTVYLGAIEKIYGTAYGLCSTPSFLPMVGNIGVEEKPSDLTGDGFPSMPLLRTNGEPPEVATLIPNDSTRSSFAMLLSELAVEFLLFHEIGHLVGGHLELHNSQSIFELDGSQDIAAPQARQILECDADLFASDVLSSVQLNSKLSMMLREFAPGVPWSTRDFSMIVYCTALGMLFRILYSNASANVFSSNSFHPHPAVRSSVACSYLYAKAMQYRNFTLQSLSLITTTSIRNIEDVWAELLLPGQCPKPLSIWALEVGQESDRLLSEYARSDKMLDGVARLPRAWRTGSPPIG